VLLRENAVMVANVTLLYLSKLGSGENGDIYASAIYRRLSFEHAGKLTVTQASNRVPSGEEIPLLPLPVQGMGW
jgi:hypothetical protein